MLETVPHTAVLARVEPVYEELPGWKKTSAARTVEDLPDQARAFLERLERLIGVRVSLVGVGRDRDALIQLPEKWSSRMPEATS